jgi:hypothetical protein
VFFLLPFAVVTTILLLLVVVVVVVATTVKVTFPLGVGIFGWTGETVVVVVVVAAALEGLVVGRAFDDSGCCCAGTAADSGRGAELLIVEDPPRLLAEIGDNGDCSPLTILKKLVHLQSIESIEECYCSVACSLLFVGCCMLHAVVC